MRAFRCTPILAAALFVAGCTPDKRPAPPEMERQAAVTHPQTMRLPSPAEADQQAEDTTLPLVVCFGDSLTAGYGADEGQSYPDYLRRALARDHVPARVVNQGISGNTTKDGLDRVDDVVELKPAVVVLEFGGNDGLRGVKVERTRANLASMIERLKQGGSKVVIAGITLPPDYGSDYVSRFTGNYASLGKQYNVPVLPFLLSDVYGVKGMMQGDNIHATNHGNEIVARNVLPYVEKALKK